MNLYIIRHTEAEYLGTGPGGDRQITPEGKAQFTSTIEGLSNSIPELDLIISSPALRTRQTMDILAELSGNGVKKEVATELRSGAPIADIYAMVNSFKEENVAIIMHEPETSLLVMNATGSGSMDIYFKPGTIAKVVFPGKMRPHAGRLHFIVPPDIFEK